MPNGNIHGPVAVGVAIVVTGAAFAEPLLTPLAVGAWCGTFCDPDLDHFVTTESERKVYRLNPLIGYIYQWYWTDYHLTHGHRGNGSHTWPKGTVVRFWYLLWAPVLVSLGWWLWQEWPIGPLLLVWAGVFAGLSINDLVHIGLDKVWGWRWT